MIRIAAAGDLHCRPDSAGQFSRWFSQLDAEADVLMLAGDLTSWGEEAETKVLVQELSGIGIPILCVLGNHDYHTEQPELVRRILEAAGVIVLEKESTQLTIRGETLGVIGTKGFAGGFGSACIAPFGEPEIKLFLRETYACAESIEHGLQGMKTDYRVVLLHYSPVADTLKGENAGIYPFLGSSILADPIDAWGADLVLHGHAHLGVEQGKTPRGIPVRNCAVSVLGRPYALYELTR